MTTIAKLSTYPLEDPLLSNGPYGSSRGLVPSRAAILVRLETSDGAVGWGEAWGGSPATRLLIDEACDELIGTRLSPSSNWLTQRLHRSYHYSSSSHLTLAASALDVAMWDAFGRTHGLAIHELLGGPTRDRLVTYASTGYVTEDNDPQRYRDQLERAAHAGYQGVKIKLGLGMPSDRERAQVAREVFGPDAALFLDFNGSYTADQTIRTLAALRDLDVSWVEEPVTPDDIEGMALLRATGIPIAAGEAVYTRYGFRTLISQRVIDVVQPDVSKCGGLSEARVIAHLAQTWNIRVSPHVWGGVVNQAASVQLLASIPDYPHTQHAPEPLWLEMDLGDNALRDELAAPLERDGTDVLVPCGPGLGIDVDESAVQALRRDR